MFQQSPQAAPKVGLKPGVSQTAVEANPSSDEQRMFMNRQPLVFDGKRMRKPVARKTIDYNSSVVRYLENRKWYKSLDSRHTIQPDESYATEVLPPSCMVDNPTNAVTTKFVRTSTNKLRCPIFCVVWTPEGRRLVTGASSGEFTLWNGLTFNFETILTAHDLPVRSMVWSHNDSWLLSGDHGGIVKYWQSNMNNVQMYEAHKEPIRGLCFSPIDNKYASCSDDGLVKIWDFYRCTEEKILRGHGADVKCIDWHPLKSLLVSGSKDSQQPIKLWDTRTGNSLATLHLHKSTVMSIKWNQNGNLLLTASRDHLLKLFDIRMMKELQSFRGHKREATAIAWHPIHETLFASGGSDGAIMFWNAGVEKDVGNMESAHDGMVWSLAWHPLGHILCSGSNDHSSKFWTRNKLGDRMRDKYNLNIQDTEDDMGDDVIGAPGFGPVNHTMAIPGMESTAADSMDFDDGFDYASLPGFKGAARSHDSEPHQPRPRGHDKPAIPGFGSPPKPAQLPPFAIPGGDLRPRFTKPNAVGRGAPFRPRGGFEMQHRPENPGPGRTEDRDHHWEPHRQPNVKFHPGPEPHPHSDEQGPPKEPREHQRPENWGPPREPPRDMDNRGRNEPRLAPDQDFPRDPRGPPPRGPLIRGPQDPGQDLRDGILGSPPHGPNSDLWSRPPAGRLGLLGPVPQFPGPLESRPGILGSQPSAEQSREDDLRRSADNDKGRDPSSPMHDVHDALPTHSRDLSSRGFRRGTTSRGSGIRRGGNPNRPLPPDRSEERNGDNRTRGHPFQRGFKGNPIGRGGTRGPPGPDDSRHPWPPSSQPSDPRFRRQEEFGPPPDRHSFEGQEWDGPPDSNQMHPREDMEFRGPPHIEPNHHGRDFGPPPRDPRPGPPFERGPPKDIGPSFERGPPKDIGPPFERGPSNDIDGRDPRGPPDAPDRRPSDDSQRPTENKPRPLMSLMSINPIVPPHGRNVELDEPDRPPLQRKRSGEGDHDREWDNIPAPQKLRFLPNPPPEERRESREGRPPDDQTPAWRGRGGMR